MSVKCYTQHIRGKYKMRDVKEAQVRQAEIMDAALSLFIEKGYLNTTTQDIIDKVKISRGLLYYHFKNKEDILYHLIERNSEPMLKKLSAIVYDKEKSAIQKMKMFIESTLVSPKDVTKEMVTLQNIVDLEQNRYMIDQFSHNFINKVTEFFSYIIEQGISENVFHVKYPLETASFLVTGYVFVSNEVKATYTDFEQINRYISAFKILLTRTLGIESVIF